MPLLLFLDLLEIFLAGIQVGRLRLPCVNAAPS